MAPQDTVPRFARRWVRVVAIAVGAVLIVLIAGFLIWAVTPLGPSETALDALGGGGDVTVTRTAQGWLFLPEGGAVPSTGLVFYPGGRVDARSYAPFARDLASRGHAVVVVRVPLSLAVFEVDAATAVLESEDLVSVKRWAVGGHSLGGAMAAQYAAENPDRVQGLLLLAAYATGSADMSGASIAVNDVTGALDGVLDRANWEAGRALLPPDAAFVTIEGGNHAQFGDYGPQPGDGGATVDAAKQRRQAVDAADALLGRM